ncbi:PAS domain-containing protein [Sulfurovum sp. XGS-02]|uniref:PAS domain-containing protein n=1 Tax=Sulfurovum sp. XGS-02 TaxID=2925411 RepID=UPI00206AC7AC|nr:PAS domain-containing protein [Sulfurovum sp. XGS-02]UPT77885.1 PAS domain-containing protein [Sulfurovum sp. XGS-02]
MLTKELHVDRHASYSSSTDENGIIISVSTDFENLSGYSKNELKGKNHNIVRHPDMPRIIFKMIWDALERGEESISYVFNHAKDGGYYWLANRTYLFSRDDQGRARYFSYKSAMSSRAKHHMLKLYTKLLEEEKKGGIEASEKYLTEYLEFRGVTFNEYMKTFLDNSGLVKTGFFMARKLFS